VGTRMKVLLTQSVENLGQVGEIKEVSGGYGRNYLIPKGFAVLATRGQIKQAEEKIVARRKRDAALRTDAEALAGRLRGATLRFVERAGSDGRLYGSVTNSDVAEKIQQELGIEVDRRKIDLEDPIKRIGNYPVTLRLISGVEAVLNVIVDDEHGSASAASAPEADTPGAAADEPEGAGEDSVSFEDDA
jgi:large subunit ribosomal protein L9